jgi:predicted aldo/keto reductase-like oxidoreductase
VQLQINYADWEELGVEARACYEVARKHGKPVVVMEPVKGGMLANPPENVAKLLRGANPEASCASWAVRFAASLDGVMTVLSGMSTVEQVEDNVSFMKDFRPLDEEEKKVMEEARREIAKIDSIPCTACSYCTAGCPEQISIPGIFRAMNAHKVFGDDGMAVNNYNFATARGHGKASDCVACGQCTDICPQHLPIIDLLKNAAARLDA